MPSYEYNVIPAPKRGVKGKGIKGAEALFANALTKAMNDAAAEGWEYLRAETLPSEERQGLTGRTTVFQNMLVFRRPVAVEVAEKVAPPIARADPEVAVSNERPASEGAVTTAAPASQSEPSEPAPTFRAHDRPAAE